MKLEDIQRIHVETEDDLSKLYANIAKEKIFAFDTETTGDNQISRTHYALLDIFGISFGYKNMVYWIELFGKNDFKETALEWIKRIMALDAIKIAHNATFDINVLHKFGVPVLGTIWDTKVMANLYNENDLSEFKLRLKPLTRKYLGWNVEELEFKKYDITDYAFDTRFNYSSNDSAACFHLANFFYKEIVKQKLFKVFDLECEVTPIVAEIERTGVCVDIPYLKRCRKILEKRLEMLEKKIFKLAGEKFNLNSSDQKAFILYTKLDMPVIKMTSGGKTRKKKKPSTDTDTLEKLNRRYSHPILELMVRRSYIAKQLSTYIIPFAENAINGKLYFSLDQAGTVTGRFASYDPNLQNLTKEKDLKDDVELTAAILEKIEISRMIKNSIYAPEGYVFVCADYSQLEYRLMVHFAKCVSLIRAFRKGDCDIHIETAAQIFGKVLARISDSERQVGKKCNFASIYGQGAQSLSDELGIPKDEAKKFLVQYFKRLPEIRKFIQDTISETRRLGFSETILGRRRRLPNINSKNKFNRAKAERQSVNAKVQGSATGDINKLALRDLKRKLFNKLKKDVAAKIVWNVHDEIGILCRKEHAEVIADKMKSIMENVISLRVPLVVDIEIKNRWAKPVKKAA